MAKLPQCLIGMGACSGAHHWARQFEALGHTVRIIAAKFVAPYRFSARKGKDDAQVICEAVQRPRMQFVPIKSDAQGRLSVHRVRQGLIETVRTVARSLGGKILIR